MEGGNYELDKIYSKGDSYSNIRFRVTDEQDKVEFSNVSDGDTFCYSTVYVDKTFDVYLVKAFPRRMISTGQRYFTIRQKTGDRTPWRCSSFSARWSCSCSSSSPARRRGARTASCRAAGRKRSPSTSIFSLTARSLRCCAWRWGEVYSYVSFYTPPYDVLLLGMSFALAVLVFAAWVTFCARVKVGGLWKGTLIYKVLCLCWKIVKWCWGVLCAFGRGVANLLHALPMIWRTAALCVLVSAATVILGGCRLLRRIL